MAAAPLVFAAGSFDLIFKCTLCFNQQPADQSGFSVIDITGRRKAQNINAQKYPSRFLSSMVFEP